MSKEWERKTIEAALRGMLDFPEKRAREIEEFNATQEWEVHCWNCRHMNRLKLADLDRRKCERCGVSLGKSD